MKRGPLNLDERDIGIIRQVCTTLYFITLFSLIVVQLYRQFVLHQEIKEHQDIAIIIAFNVLVLLGSVLYLGGVVSPRRFNWRWVIAGYLVFVVIGLGFTIFKYTVLLGQDLSWARVADYLLVVVKVSGLIALGLGLLAYLGSRRIDKQIE